MGGHPKPPPRPARHRSGQSPGGRPRQRGPFGPFGLDGPPAGVHLLAAVIELDPASGPLKLAEPAGLAGRDVTGEPVQPALFFQGKDRPGRLRGRSWRDDLVALGG